MTHNTREGIEEKTDCELYEHIPEPYDVAFWHCKVCGKELYFDTIESLKTHHQELQKARADWLREEIVKLEGERPKGIPVIIEKGSEFTTPRMYRELGYARAIDDTIKRYQSELDQPLPDNI